MPMFSTLDYVALAWFIGAWAIYSITLSLTERRMQGLNSEMNRYRDVWMFQMLGRDMRMVDAQIVAALQNGTAFFASTSLIAIGGALTLLRSSDVILEVVAALPIGVKMTPVQWEAKTMGLAIIFVDGCARSPAGTSTAVSARSSSRSAISAGSSARGC